MLFKTTAVAFILPPIYSYWSIFHARLHCKLAIDHHIVFLSNSPSANENDPNDSCDHDNNNNNYGGHLKVYEENYLFRAEIRSDSILGKCLLQVNLSFNLFSLII